MGPRVQKCLCHRPLPCRLCLQEFFTEALAPAGVSGPAEWALLTFPCSHRDCPVIIFCLGKWLPLSQLIYLFLPNERFTFSSGQKSEREHSGFSHPKSWAAFPAGDNNQIAEDSTHFKLVKWELLCESFSFHSLFHSYIQTDSTVGSEKASVKCYIDMVTILLPRASPRAWVSAFFLHWKFFLKPYSALHELEPSPRDS